MTETRTRPSKVAAALPPVVQAIGVAVGAYGVFLAFSLAVALIVVGVLLLVGGALSEAGRI